MDTDMCCHDVVESWPDEWKDLWRTCFASHDEEKLFHGVMQVRQWLSVENPPIEEAVKGNVILRKLIELLAHPLDTIRFEACWALTNVCSGPSRCTEAAVAEGAIGAVIAHILTSSDASVVEQGLWCIGNIAGDSPVLRNQVIAAGAIDAFLSLFGRFNTPTFLHNYIWAVSNLCRGRPGPPFDAVSRFLPVIANLLTSQDDTVLTDALWACSYLTDGPNTHIAAVVACGILPVVIEKLYCSHLAVPALRTLGNVIAGDDKLTQHAIDCGALQVLAALLADPKKSMRKEACWALSNIADGTEQQVRALLESGCIPRLVSMSVNDEEDVRKEAVWAISNCTNVASLCSNLAEAGGFSSLAMNTIHPLDIKVAQVAVAGLNNIATAMCDITSCIPTEGDYNQLVAALEGYATNHPDTPIASDSEALLVYLGCRRRGRPLPSPSRPFTFSFP
eukprot:Sspe_Gene.39959::Locus_19270_Transcript_1_1_Confidence_1.000_Length_1752::g.39959::m.39959